MFKFIITLLIIISPIIFAKKKKHHHGHKHHNVGSIGHAPKANDPPPQPQPIQDIGPKCGANEINIGGLNQNICRLIEGSPEYVKCVQDSYKGYSGMMCGVSMCGGGEGSLRAAESFCKKRFSQSPVLEQKVSGQSTL